MLSAECIMLAVSIFSIVLEKQSETHNIHSVSLAVSVRFSLTYEVSYMAECVVCERREEA